jgi:photosystem II stability/assembly factor-like uncharacterized protein
MGIACPSTTTCYAVGGNEIVATTDGGGMWTQTAAPTGSDPLVGIACSTTTACVAVGNVLGCLLGENDPCPPGPFPVISTTDGGAVWTGHPLPADVSPTSIACPTTTVSTCEVAAFLGPATDYPMGGSGGILRSTDRGANWINQTVPPETGDLDGIACPSATTCYAVGEGREGVGGLVLKDTS